MENNNIDKAYSASHFGIQRVDIIMSFEHHERKYFVYQDNKGDYIVCDYLTGYSAHTDSKMEKCISRAKAKINKAIANNFNWSIYPSLNAPENIAAFERIEALMRTIEDTSKINLRNRIKIKF